MDVVNDVKFEFRIQLQWRADYHRDTGPFRKRSRLGDLYTSFNNEGAPDAQKQATLRRCASMHRSYRRRCCCRSQP